VAHVFLRHGRAKRGIFDEAFSLKKIGLGKQDTVRRRFIAGRTFF